MNSDTGVWEQAKKSQLKAPALRCIVLRPETTGEVLKRKKMLLTFDVQESAGTLFTVKPPAPQPLN